MTVVPNLNAKLLGEMAPGELVRFQFRGKMLLGIVAKCDFIQMPSNLIVLVLENLPDHAPIRGGFLPMTEYLMAQPSLSYGTKHVVVVQTGAQIISPSDMRFNANGVLLVIGDRRAIRSSIITGDFQDLMIRIDIEKWEAIPTTTPSYSVMQVGVLAWELRLLIDLLPESPLPPVFTFALGD